MTDKITKSLQKLSAAEQKQVKQLLLQIKAGQLTALNLKKLKGRDDIFRVRKGKLRIIFQKQAKTIKILAIERRSKTTYRDY